MENDDDDDRLSELPTLEDLMTPPAPRCMKCGSESVRSDSPAMRWVVLVGGGMSAWVFFRGPIDAAILILVATVTLAAGVRARYHFRRCDACGHEWRRTDEHLE